MQSQEKEPLPQFIAEIDGLEIHFIPVRSKHESALPLIVTHGKMTGCIKVTIRFSNYNPGRIT